jgi:hypothetical protein
MAAVDGIFFDEKRMLGLGWPLDVVEAIKRVFESDAVTLSIKVAANELAIAINSNSISDNSDDIILNSNAIIALALIVSDKIDKVSGATLDNFATLLANGNVQDSGLNASDFTVIIGTGSPEGVTASNQSKLYIDDAIPAQYFNPAIGTNTGWIAL